MSKRSLFVLGQLTMIPGVCDGELIFTATRIKVALVTARLIDGASDREIIGEFPSLTLSDVITARRMLATERKGTK